MFYSAGSLNCHLTRQSGGKLSGYGDKRNCPFGFQPVATELDAEIKHEKEDRIVCCVYVGGGGCLYWTKLIKKMDRDKDRH